MDSLSNKQYLSVDGDSSVKRQKMEDSDDEEENLECIELIERVYETFVQFVADGSSHSQIILKADSVAKGEIVVEGADEAQLQKLVKEGWVVASSELDSNDDIISRNLKYSTTFEKISMLIDSFNKWELWGLNRSAQDKIREILDYKQSIPPYIIPRSVISKFRHYAEEEGPKESKYDRQFIIDLGSGESAKGLSEKRSFLYHKPSEIIKWGKNGNQEFASRVTLSSRIYLVGHCGPTIDFISSDEKKATFSAEELVKILDNVECLKVENLKTYQGKRLNIRIVGCHSANMADQIAKKLSAINVPAVVSGATDKTLRGVFFDGMEQEYFKSVVNGDHHWHKRGKASYLS